jgi:hypothetical protein
VGDGSVVDPIPIADQVAWGLSPRECLCDLAGDLAPVQIIFVRLSGVKLVFGRRLSALIVFHGSRAFSSAEASEPKTLAL